MLGYLDVNVWLGCSSEALSSVEFDKAGLGGNFLSNFQVIFFEASGLIRRGVRHRRILESVDIRRMIYGNFKLELRTCILIA